jgi:hypothetical protein
MIVAVVLTISCMLLIFGVRRRRRSDVRQGNADMMGKSAKTQMNPVFEISRGPDGRWTSQSVADDDDFERGKIIGPVLDSPSGVRSKAVLAPGKGRSLHLNPVFDPLHVNRPTSSVVDEENANTLEDWINAHERPPPPSHSPSDDNRKTRPQPTPVVTGGQWTTREQVRQAPSQNIAPKADGASGLVMALEQTNNRIERIGSFSKPKRENTAASGDGDGDGGGSVADVPTERVQPAPEGESPAYLWPADIQAQRESRGPQRESRGRDNARDFAGAPTDVLRPITTTRAPVSTSDIPTNALNAQHASFAVGDDYRVTPPKAFAVGNDYRVTPPQALSTRHVSSKRSSKRGSKRRTASGSSVETPSTSSASGAAGRTSELDGGGDDNDNKNDEDDEDDDGEEDEEDEDEESEEGDDDDDDNDDVSHF